MGNLSCRRLRLPYQAAGSIPDEKYVSLEQVTAALRAGGLESSSMIVGIDFTKSNLYQGAKTFGGHSLHSGRHDSPYARVIQIVGRTMETFDDDNRIPAFLFGDLDTKDKFVKQLAVQSAYPKLERPEPSAPSLEGKCITAGCDSTESLVSEPGSTVFSSETFQTLHPCVGFSQVLDAYLEATERIADPAAHPLGYTRQPRDIVLSGPTSFAPLIRQAINVVQSTGEYHILIVIADGAVTNIEETEQAIVDASEFALSIICVGVGDGPWTTMESFDDGLPQRKFDNFQFVPYRFGMSDAEFALEALREIPRQFTYIRDHKMLGCTPCATTRPCNWIHSTVWTSRSAGSK